MLLGSLDLVAVRALPGEVLIGELLSETRSIDDLSLKFADAVPVSQLQFEPPNNELDDLVAI